MFYWFLIMMYPRHILPWAVSVTALTLYPWATETAKSAGEQVVLRPNVIIIYGDLSYNGYASIRTPNADRLNTEGLHMANAHTTSLNSTSSRYGLFTGHYPWRKQGTGITTGDAGMMIASGQHCTRSTLCKSII